MTSSGNSWSKPAGRPATGRRPGMSPLLTLFRWSANETARATWTSCAGELQEGGKQPYFVHEPDRDIAMAGIIRPWADKTKPRDDPDRWRLAMAIITRDAHVAPGEVHDRMPACLTPDAYDDWLGDRLSVDEVWRMLDFTSLEVANQLTYYPVSKAVNSVKNDGPELVEALAT